MSWLFAFTGLNSSEHRNTSYCHNSPLYQIKTSKFYLAIGGNPDTCFYESNTDNSQGWAVIGTGILQSDSGVNILTQNEWSKILNKDSLDTKSIDGHFFIIRWKDNSIECFTDQLGLRSVYFGKNKDGVYISTRIDWLARSLDKSEIDFDSIGCRFLLFNQISYASGLKGIERLGPGGYAKFKNGSIIESVYVPWLPSFELSTTDKAIKILKNFIICALENKYTPSLGLSGGLDSRTLLALLMSVSKEGFSTHTIGYTNEPDVQISKQIISTLGLPHFHFNDPLPDIQVCIKNIQSYIAQTCFIESGTSFLRLRYFQKLKENGKFLIDGGFGEISRRQYLNRFVKFGKSALHRRDFNRLFQLMRLPRADIFSPDTTQILKKSALCSLERAINEMPSIEKIGIENFADLFSVRTRIPNYGGPEQARLDGDILNFMPLSQPSFLQTIFGIPIKFRSNASINYEIIRKFRPELEKFPLAKAGYTLPFGISYNLAWLLGKAKLKFTKTFSDPIPHLFFLHMKEFVLDTIHSTDISQNPVYNSQNIINAGIKYYQGETNYFNILDWWLTFELWKKSLSNNNYNC